MIDKIVNAQTDFSGGQINEGAKRVLNEQVEHGGVAMTNFRVEAQGTLVNRPGREALYPSSARTETFRMSSSVTVQVTFFPGGLAITDTLGNVQQSYVGALAGWQSTADIQSISVVAAVQDIIICFGNLQPVVCRWTPSSNTWVVISYVFDDDAGLSQEPFYRLNVKGATMSWSASANYKVVGDTITLTCSSNYFVAAMIGAILSILGGQVQITSISSPTAAVVTILSPIPDSIVITPTALGPFQVGQIVETTTTGYEFEIFAIGGGNIAGPIMNNNTFTSSSSSTVDQVSSELGISNYTPSTGMALYTGTTGTVQWSEEFMSAIAGWPNSVFYDKSRVGFCDFPQKPEAILWCAIGLNNNAYIDAAAASVNQSAGADASAGILEFIDNRPRVRNVVGWSGDEFAFTDLGIYQIPIGTANPLKPGSVAFLQFSDDGVSGIRPISTLDTIVYINYGLTRVSVVRATGSLTRPYISDDISALHSDLMVDPVSIAIQDGDGPDPERYIYVVTADGDAIQGRFTPQKQIVGWVPIDAIGSITWISYYLGNVYYNVLYSPPNLPSGLGGWLLEVENADFGQDGSILINNIPAPMKPPAGFGPLWWLAGGTVTLTDMGLDIGDRAVDSMGNIVWLQEDFQGTEITSPTLQGGALITATFTPVTPEAASGASTHQRLRRRRISRALARVNTNAQFNWGGKDISPYQWGDDATQPAPTRETSYRTRQIGRSFDPQMPLILNRPGFFRLMECVIEVTT